MGLRVRVRVEVRGLALAELHELDLGVGRVLALGAADAALDDDVEGLRVLT